ncbi:MAG: hypothetical protein JO314_02700 [Acidobacteria bacterium]|nr:hypothetical protein [Acidobacteriota bacterium]
MLISLILIILITLGGLAITYLIDREETLMWRLAVGNVVGSCIFGLCAFAVANFAGLTTTVVIASLIVTLLPALLFVRNDVRGQLRRDLQHAGSRLRDANTARFIGFAYYAFFFLLFWAFFGKAMWEAKDGIYTGGSQNLGDLPFHLGAIFSFTDGANFPPQNPSWAGARFSYPFIADLVTAGFVRLGASVSDAIAWQDISWAMSLLVILDRFTAKLTASKLAGRIAPALLFFSGGLGFLWFLKDWWAGDATFSHLTHDYTISDAFRWGNSMVVLFITQRSLLLGMPLTVAVMSGIWNISAAEPTEQREADLSHSLTPRFSYSLSSLLLGLLAGLLPLVHLHSLAALFIVTAFCFAMRPARWKEWLMFGAGVAISAIPELLWAMSGTATETKSFFGFNWGWDKGDDDWFLWFWIKNTGLTIPLILAGAWLLWKGRNPTDSPTASTHPKAKGHKTKTKHLPILHGTELLEFYLPFAFLFVICNIAKFAPWEWDNIKLLIYWLVGSLPLIAYLLTWLWQRKGIVSYVAVVCFIALIFAGFLDVWRTASGQINTQVFDAEAVKIGDAIRSKTDPHAIILNYPTFNTPAVLSGRLSLIRYPGHLSSHGIDFGGREKDVKTIYSGGGVADIMLRKYNVDYVLVGPEERSKLQANESFFSQYPVVADTGQYRLYKVKWAKPTHRQFKPSG